MITGAAGFIGSHLADTLLNSGSEVIGVDCLTPYYSSELKRRNLGYLERRKGWSYSARRIGQVTADDLDGVDVVFHLAAQPGVRASWEDFDTYAALNLVEMNSLATSIVRADVPTVVFASSSSVYGDLSSYPAHEENQTCPRSPYGVTKLAGEKLWDSYAFAHPRRIAALRFFTVYGPGQRPDMATHRLIRAALDGGTFRLFGDGEQRRDFTYVTDVVRACIDIANCPELKTEHVNVLNVGGSGDVSMRQLVNIVQNATGRNISIEWMPAQVGDVRRTGADATAIKQLAGWSPAIAIEEGIQRHVAYQKDSSLETWRSQ